MAIKSANCMHGTSQPPFYWYAKQAATAANQTVRPSIWWIQNWFVAQPKNCAMHWLNWIKKRLACDFETTNRIISFNYWQTNFRFDFFFVLNFLFALLSFLMCLLKITSLFLFRVKWSKSFGLAYIWWHLMSLVSHRGHWLHLHSSVGRNWKQFEIPI